MTALTRALGRAWYATGAAGFGWIPRPLGHAQASGRGPEPLQILLLGGGPAVSWGVASHDLGYAGWFAREPAQRTGRGVDVLVAADHSIDARAAIAAVRGFDLPSFDGIVLTLGVEDAVRGTRPSQWRRRMSVLINDIRAAAPELRIFVAGIQPIRSIPAYDHAIADALAVDARALDEEAELLCAGKRSVLYVAMQPQPWPISGPRRTPKDYPYWGSLLASGVAPALRSGDSVEATPTLV